MAPDLKPLGFSTGWHERLAHRLRDGNENLVLHDDRAGFEAAAARRGRHKLR